MPKYKMICIDCGREFEMDTVLYVCPDCAIRQTAGQPLLGVLLLKYEYKKIKKNFTVAKLKKNCDQTIARYIDLLPIKKAESLPPLTVTRTPLDPAERIRKKLGLKKLFIKNDTLLPTGSFKDRASAVVVAKAIELKKNIITTASTGNAATALAGMCASTGVKSVIFVPETAPVAKLTQIKMFGAELKTVKGTYDDAFQESLKATKDHGWYNRNTAYNPHTIDGKKTAALEIWEQLGYKAPDKVFIPTGDGVILAGTYKGFYDLKKLGLIKKIPQMIAVQAEGSDAITRAFETGKFAKISAHTIADSISVSKPACGRLAVKILKETKGFGIRVTDKEILKAEKELAELTGIFAEPAASATYAGLKKYLRSPSPSRGEGRGEGENIVLLITGTGLKDIPAAARSLDT